MKLPVVGNGQSQFLVHKPARFTYNTQDFNLEDFSFKSVRHKQQLSLFFLEKSVEVVVLSKRTYPSCWTGHPPVFWPYLNFAKYTGYYSVPGKY